VTLYLAVEDDKYERIVYMESNMKALAEKIGVKTCTAWSALSKHMRCGGYYIEKVVIEEEQ
jgi:hypothetical protein